MRALGVVQHVELVDPLLQLLDRFGQRLLVEPLEQGPVEAFVLALRGRLAGLAGPCPQLVDTGCDYAAGRSVTVEPRS